MSKQQYVVQFARLGGRLDSKFAVLGFGLAVRTTRAAGFGAGPERFVHDLLDRPGTTAALGAATEASVDLSGRARRHLRHTYCITHVVVGKNVAGTDDHETAHKVGINGLC